MLAHLSLGLLAGVPKGAVNEHQVLPLEPLTHLRHVEEVGVPALMAQVAEFAVIVERHLMEKRTRLAGLLAGLEEPDQRVPWDGQNRNLHRILQDYPRTPKHAQLPARKTVELLAELLAGLEDHKPAGWRTVEGADDSNRVVSGQPNLIARLHPVNLRRHRPTTAEDRLHVAESLPEVADEGLGSVDMKGPTRLQKSVTSHQERQGTCMVRMTVGQEHVLRVYAQIRACVKDALQPRTVDGRLTPPLSHPRKGESTDVECLHDPRTVTQPADPYTEKNLV